MDKFLKIGLRLTADQRGITGLETAIVLIAFVVVASVFAFTVLTTGLFTSKEAEKASRAALTSAEATLVQISSAVAGGTCPGCVDWAPCPGGFDNGNCQAHPQLVRFKLTPAGDDPVGFDPEAVHIFWHDTGSGRRGDGPISLKVPLMQTTPLLPGEAGVNACVGGSHWCFRWEPGETDRTLETGENVEIFIGAQSGAIHQIEKNTLITIEVILPNGPVVMINAKMPPVIMDVMDLSP